MRMNYVWFTPIVCCRRKRGVIEEATIKSEVKQSPGCIGYNNLASSIDRDTLEFPHMAILGYGIKDSIEWRCTGALISEKHVLTSATCANTELGQIQYVNLGEPKSVQTFMVKTIHFHPERSIYSYYHDIALIELDGNVNLNGPIKPACLQTQKSLPEGHPKVSNWKLFNYTNKWLDTIEMIYVPFEDCKDAHKPIEMIYVPFEDCKDAHKPQAYLEGGVRDDWQICAVGKNRGADTCKVSLLIGKFALLVKIEVQILVRVRVGHHYR
ncbi:Trypsin [Popillia japonica]|uniref:Trypsin n=1 Tax=Popillia japonica TaxID=7064 RepID=A0AAW1LUC4_POPJA